MLIILEMLTFEVDVLNTKDFTSEIKRLSNLICYFTY